MAAASVVCALVAVGWATEAKNQARPDVVSTWVIWLQPLGSFPRALLDPIAEAAAATFGAEVRRADPVPLPEEAYYPPRRRYRAERLLVFLGRIASDAPPTTKILGLTSVDISTTKGRIHDWGIFGLGELGGRAAVVSTHRLRRRARDEAHLRFRVVTTAIHELGHAFGLPHCDEPRCVMRDAEGTIRTVDESTGTLGPVCRARLERQLGSEPSATQPRTPH
ncbi:MAG: hypothetical protein NZ898_07070 [Myxococcota bacterium]|nr:hypothetical protein [Myxococcota bacterium]MDW8362570.1 hypothetical protein [Myxococcales bacterium]